MRRLLLILLIALPTVVLAADAKDGQPQTSAATTQTAGAQTAQAATQPATAIPAPPPTPVTDPADCRMTCAQTRYFCQAGDNADGCTSAWTQCVATCTSPNLDPGVSTAP
jgi:hypothetical protein